eukprot:7291757-Prymnesium_polylepis.1
MHVGCLEARSPEASGTPGQLHRDGGSLELRAVSIVLVCGDTRVGRRPVSSHEGIIRQPRYLRGVNNSHSILHPFPFPQHCSGSTTQVRSG